MKINPGQMNRIFESSQQIDENIFSLTKIILLFLNIYYRDGLQYRELKTMVKISDGKLISNLNKLTELELLEKEMVKIDKKELNFYRITVKGKQQVNLFLEWIDVMKLTLSEVE